MLHPVVIYYKKNEKLKHFLYWVISDGIEKDVAVVCQVQNEALKKVLPDIPETKDVAFFQIVVQVNIKTGKNYLICVNIVLNLELIGINWT